MKNQEQIKEKETSSDEEINELAEWLEDLTLKQCFFLKDTYESWLRENAISIGSKHVH